MAKVLIADAHPAGLAGIAEGLRAAGYEVVLAGDDEAALAGAASGPDVICLDVLLPGAGAFALYPRLKAIRPVPVILMLERLDDRISAGVAATGAEDLLFKPFELYEVIDKVAWYLEGG